MTRNYTEIRECLLNMGFKCVDTTKRGDEVFEQNNIEFAVYEVEK